MINCDFDILQKRLNPYYAVQYTHGIGKRLVIVFSVNKKFSLQKYNFNCSTLLIADLRILYYITNAFESSQAMHSFIVALGFEEVVFLGASKGGAGALLWSAIVQSEKKTEYPTIRCLAIGPQTQLYPFNDNISSLPSYSRLLNACMKHKKVRRDMLIYGNICRYIRKSTPPTLVCYSSKNKMDISEAFKFLDNKAVSFYQIPIPFHPPTPALLINTEFENEIDKLYARLLLNAKYDADLAANLPTDRSEFVAIYKNLNVLKLPELIDLVCSKPEVLRQLD